MDALKQVRYVKIWQFFFILFGTSWIWVAHVNTVISSRQSFISHFEASGQPYAWLFRMCDFIAALLLLAIAYTYSKSKLKRTPAIILFVIGTVMLLDPLFTTTCIVRNGLCTDYVSFTFFIHIAETIIATLAILLLNAYDVWKRNRLISILFIVAECFFAFLFFDSLSHDGQFTTVAHIAYQSIVILWLAWYVRDALTAEKPLLPAVKPRPINWFFASLAFANGLISVLFSIAHISIPGVFEGLYFIRGNDWLVEHGVLVGIIMLYLSRKILYGERRAQQILLVILGMEVIKYSVITPASWLLLIFWMSFMVLFVSKDFFDRGTIPLTTRLRVREVLYILTSLIVVTGAAILILFKDQHIVSITNRSLENFTDFISDSPAFTTGHNLPSAILARTIFVASVAAILLVLWALFRPVSATHELHGEVETATVARLLDEYSTSSEDYFKFFPTDKKYFWNDDRTAFIAYKQSAGILFALADPIASDEKARVQILRQFMVWARAHRLSICFIPIEEGSNHLYKDCGLESLQIGSSAYIDTNDFTTHTVRDKWWRWQSNRATKLGYTYAIAKPPHSPELIRELRTVSNEWLKLNGKAEHNFAMGYFDEAYLQQCEVHCLLDGEGKITAFANQVPIFRPSSVATVDLLRYNAANSNSMPVLLMHIISHCHQKGITSFDLGFVPFARSDQLITKVARNLTANRFSSRGLEQFKNKFDPQWRACYAAYDGDLGNLAIIMANFEKVTSL